MIGPDATVTLDFLLARLTGLIDKLVSTRITWRRTLTAWAVWCIRSASSLH